MRARAVRGFVVGVAAVTMSLLAAGPAAAEPPALDATTTLQVPGVIVAWPLTRGAAVVSPTVQHGHGWIALGPAGNAWVVQWTNLSTGASGVLTGPDAVFAGAGQVVAVATPQPAFLGDITSIPSIGTFAVTT